MKAQVTDLIEIAEDRRDEYVQTGDVFVLKVEGTHPDLVPVADHAAVQANVIEFRDRTTGLLKHAANILGVTEVADLSGIELKIKSYADVAAENAKLVADANELGKKGVKNPDDIKLLIESAVSSAVEPLKEGLTQERAAREEAQRRLDSSTLRDAVTSVALKAGAKRNAVEFLVTQAQNVFEVVEGVVRPKGNAYSKANPGELLSVPEWMTGATKEFDFAFEPSGGGNTGPTSGAPEGVRGAKQLVDPTPQQLGKFADQIAAGELIVVNTVDALI